MNSELIVRLAMARVLQVWPPRSEEQYFADFLMLVATTVLLPSERAVDEGYAILVEEILDDYDQVLDRGDGRAAAWALLVLLDELSYYSGRSHDNPLTSDERAQIITRLSDDEIRQAAEGRLTGEALDRERLDQILSSQNLA